MAFLSSSFVILAAVAQNIFFINNIPNVRDAFVCFGNNSLELNSTCNTWPNGWIRLYPKNLNNGNLHVLSTKMDKLQNEKETYNVLYYKLRFFFNDQTMGETRNWANILNGTYTDKPFLHNKTTLPQQCDKADNNSFLENIDKENNCHAISTSLWMIFIALLILLTFVLVSLYQAHKVYKVIR